jgi:hypothetical protein
MSNTKYTGDEVIGGLLVGGSKLFGMPVELAFMKGLPPGMTKEDIEAIGRDLAPKQQPVDWIPAEEVTSDRINEMFDEWAKHENMLQNLSEEQYIELRKAFAAGYLTGKARIR